MTFRLTLRGEPKIADGTDIPQDVLQFISEQIDSVPHLEALLLLYRQPAEQWTVQRVAARLYVAEETARKILEELELRKLARRRPDLATAEYAYDAAWEGGGRLMESTAEAYSRYLVAVVALIHSKPPRSVLEFARAFDFKKDR